MPSDAGGPDLASFSSIVGEYDTLIFVATLSTKSNPTALHIGRAQPMEASPAEAFCGMRDARL